MTTAKTNTKTKAKTTKAPAAAGKLHAGEAQAGREGIRIYALESDNRAAGYACDSRHGGQGAAFGGDSSIAVSRQ
jgi:hypothetical protein